MKILLVEDLYELGVGSQLHLRLLGHQCELAPSGHFALAMAENFIPDLALIDIGLPDIDGIEVGRRLRGMISWDKVVLVALTSYNEQENCFRVGFDYFRNKPMDFKILPDLFEKGRVFHVPAV